MLVKLVESIFLRAVLVANSGPTFGSHCETIGLDRWNRNCGHRSLCLWPILLGWLQISNHLIWIYFNSIISLSISKVRFLSDYTNFFLDGRQRSILSNRISCLTRIFIALSLMLSMLIYLFVYGLKIALDMPNMVRFYLFYWLKGS